MQIKGFSHFINNYNSVYLFVIFVFEILTNFNESLTNDVANFEYLGPDVIVIRAASWENQQSAYAKPKTQISFAVTAKLISAFVFATRIVQFLFYLNSKFQASSSFL